MVKAKKQKKDHKTMLEKTLINGITKMMEPANGKPDYSLTGFNDAARVKGSVIAYNLCLEKFYTSLLLNYNSREEVINEHNLQIQDEINRLNEKIDLKKDELLDLNENKIPEGQKLLDKAQADHLDFQQNPSKYLNVQKDKFMLWLYGILSVLIAAFLYVFYGSVVYSAFFREINLDKMTWYNSIFYPKAFEESLSIGFTAFLVVCLAPFIFIALGIFIDTLKHKSKTKIKLGYIAGLVFTFILDALLAYHISERIYESKAINVFDNVEPFNLFKAIQNLDFWIIIAMGFCVYILFGKIFSLYNEQRSFRNEFEKVNNSLKMKIQIAEEKLNELNTQVEKIKSEILDYENQITDLRKKPQVVVFNPLELKNILSEYTIGWVAFMKNAGSLESEIKQIEEELKLFYQLKGVINDEKK